jgi:predicted RND superfamily exporter protein
MQTLSVQVQDDYMQQFMNFVKNSHSNVTISKDKNLELDPYFYERQKQLHQDLEEVESFKAEMISHDDLWSNINNHLKSKNS